MGKEFIAPEGVHQPRGYSHAVRVGNTIYVAGVVKVNTYLKDISPAPQYRQLRERYFTPPLPCLHSGPNSRAGRPP